MRIQLYSMILVLGSGVLACGDMPSSYNQVALACGGLDPEADLSASTVVRVVGDGKNYDPARVSATWSEKGIDTNLRVSPRGCVLKPQTSGVLKLVSDNRKYGMVLTKRLNPSSSVVDIGLESLKSAHFRLSCRGAAVLRSPTDLTLSFDWDSLRQDDFWQIARMRYQIEEQGQATTAVQLQLEADGPPQAALILDPPLLKDGSYILTAQVQTLAGDLVNAENSCAFELDQTAPEKPDLLNTKVVPSDGPLRLRLGTGSDETIFCIEVPGGKDCDKLEDFDLASEFVPIPNAGPLTLYSYRRDRAGNLSDLVKLDFFSDTEAPRIQFSWLNPPLARGVNWASDPHETFAFQLHVSDDAMDAGFMGLSELEDAMECRVFYVDQAGGRFAANQAVCTEGRCKGLRLDDWAPCAGKIEFQFHDDILRPLLQTSIEVEVRTFDKAGRQGSTSGNFWILADALSSWQNSNLSFPFRETQLNFVNDSFGNFWAFSSSISGPNQSDPVVFFKALGAAEWSAPMPIQTQGLSPIALQEQNMFLSRGFDMESPHESLWLVDSKQQTTLVEVPLANTSSLAARGYPIPDSLLKKMGDLGPWERLAIEGIIEFVDDEGRRKLHLLVNRLDWQGTVSFLFVSFDGSQFAFVADSSEISHSIYRAGPGLLQGPGAKIIFLINGQVASLDPNQAVLSYPSVTPTLPTGIRSLYKDRRGFFGLTNVTTQPFSMSFAAEGDQANLELWSANKPFEGLSNINHLVRKMDNSFWLSAQGTSGAPILLAWKPWVTATTGWVVQDAIWDWPTSTETVLSFGLGIDQSLDQVAVTTLQDSFGSGSDRLVLRMMLSRNFLEVTDKGLFRSGLESRPTQRVMLAQSSDMDLHRLSYWRTRDDAFLAVSTMNVNSPARGISLKPLVAGSPFLMNSAFDFIQLDGLGRVWFEDSLTGIVKRLEPVADVFEPKFEVAAHFSKWRHIDSRGNYWGSLGLSFTGIQLKRPDSELRSLNLPEGLVGEKVVWAEPKSWIIAHQAGQETSVLLELDMASGEFKEDLQLQVSGGKFIDIVSFQQRRLALVRRSNQSRGIADGLALLQIYEDNGQAWVAWSDSTQIRWPAWHQSAGQGVYIADTIGAEATIFYQAGDPGVVWVAGMAQGTDGPLLARLSLDAKTWTVFNPHTETLKDPVKKFWLDAENRLILQSSSQIFYFNEAIMQTTD